MNNDDKFEEKSNEFADAEKSWAPPPVSAIKYSTVSEEHKAHLARRKSKKKGKRRNGKKEKPKSKTEARSFPAKKGEREARMGKSDDGTVKNNGRCRRRKSK